MSILWMEGFDQYPDDNVAGQANFGPSGDVMLGSTYARFGGKGIRAAYVDDTFLLRLRDPGSAALNTFTFGFAMYLVGTSPDSGDICLVGDRPYYSSFGAGVDHNDAHLRLVSNTSAQISLIGTGTTPQTAYYDVPVNKWVYIEIVQDGANDQLSLYMNGSLLETVALDVSGRCSPNWFSISRGLNNASGFERNMDDMYLSDVATSLGDVRVETRLPTADTAEEDWVTSDASADSFATVNAIDSTWADKWIESSTVDSLSLFTSNEPLSGVPATIHAVCVQAIAAQSNAGSRTWAVTAGNGVDEPVRSPVSAGFVPYSGLRLIMNQTPALSPANWGAGDVLSLQFGVDLRS